MKLAFSLAVALLVSVAPASAAGTVSGQKLVTMQGDGVFPFVDGYSVPAGACTNPLTNLAQVANLRAAFAAEKAYLQEKDRYAPLATVGFRAEPGWAAFCWQYVITLAHITYGNIPEPTFFVTARQKNGTGPMLCVSSEHIAGQINESNSGVIADAAARGNLPQARSQGFNMERAPFVLPRPSPSPIGRP